MKILAFLLVLFSLYQFRVDAQDKRLLSSSEYRDLLDKIQGESGKWEASLKNVDPAKTNVSYSIGKQIEQWRDLALKEVVWTRQSVAKERLKHSVSGELELRGFLQGVFDMMDNVVRTEVAAGVTLSDVEKYAPEISSLLLRMSNDVTARVELLEKGNCP